MNRNDISEVLFQESLKVRINEADIIHVEKMVDSTAFFPGGRGLWLDNIVADIFPDIMFIGQDFGMVSDYKDIINGKCKDTDTQTWKQLNALLDEVNKSTPFDRRRCFFTNAYMGLRKNGEKTGNISGSEEQNIFHSNKSFLAYQIKLIKPKAIITLGAPAAMMMGWLSEELSDWKQEKPFKHFDVKNRSLVEGVYIQGHKSICLRLVHPSWRHRNYRHRIYDLTKDTYKDAEVGYLIQLMKKL